MDIKKIYSGEYFSNNPPKWSWICEICGEVGLEQKETISSKNLSLYADLMVKFNKEYYFINLLHKIRPLEPDYAKIVNEYFWDLI